MVRIVSYKASLEGVLRTSLVSLGSSNSSPSRVLDLLDAEVKHLKKVRGKFGKRFDWFINSQHLDSLGRLK